MECRHELALRRGVPASDEHSMLTSDVQLHLELVQHHLQTLPVLTVNFRQPSHGFTFSVGINLLF
jgi:hypothetical protein